MTPEQEQELHSLQQQLRDLAARKQQATFKKIGDAYVELLLELFSKAQLGLDGNAGYALLGPNLQDGVAYFIPVSRRPGESRMHARRRAAMQAYSQLLNKVGKSPKELPFVWESK